MKYLVVGANGFIGSWICRLLTEDNIPVIALNRSINPERTSAVLSGRHHARIAWVSGDIRDKAQINELVSQGVTHIISLAGMLRPASEVYSPESIAVSVGGLLNLLDAAGQDGHNLPLVYSSAGAVYGMGSAYHDGIVTNRDTPKPVDHYGVQRYAMEMTADVAWRARRIGSVGLRPWIVCGAGRESGLTAGPSLALRAAAARKSFHIGFGGKSVYHHVADVAAAYIAASRVMAQGAVVANIPGETLEISDFVAMVEHEVPEMRGKITFDSATLNAPHIVQDHALEDLTGFNRYKSAKEWIPRSIRDYELIISNNLADMTAID